MDRITDSAYRSDFLAVAVAIATVWLAGIYLDLFEVIHTYLHAFEQFQLDELLMAILSLSIGASWLSWRRWQESEQARVVLKQSEARLMDTQAKYDEVQMLAHLGHWELDLITSELTWSDENHRIFGVEPGSVNTYDTFLETVHPDDLEYVNSSYLISVENRTNYDIEHRLLLPDGSIKWVRERCNTYYGEDGKPLRSIGTVHDITEFKRVQKGIEESHARFSGIIDQAEDAIVTINSDQKIVLFNSSAERTFGYSQQEVIGQRLELLLPERFRVGHHKHVEGFQSNSADHMIKSCRGLTGLRKNGEEFPIDGSISSQKLGDSVEMTIIFRDISEQLKSQELLRKVSKAVEEAGEAIMITDCNAVIEYVNPAFCTNTGYSLEEVVGKNPSILKSEAQDPKHYENLWSTISRGEVWSGALIDRRKDGSYYPAMMTISPIHDELGEITHYVSLQQDMTEYKRMEEQFLQAQKMESIGTLVGGIAHDFNNMLAAIEGNLYLAKMKLTKNEPDKVFSKIENIEKISLSAAEMVKQLLTFARRDSVSMTNLPLKPYLKEALKLSRSAIPENIEIVPDLCDDELHIQGESTQIQQLVMNLLNNARDALSGVAEPKITVQLSLFVLNEQFRRDHPEISSDTMALLTIADNGCGISEANQDKVFEPFFTTKGVGKGTGLGLAMVFGAVKRHGGVIELESGKDSGTEFRIYLPLVTEATEDIAEHSSNIAIGQNETVLLVDDEEMLRETTSELLKNLGYRVLEAADGQEALQVFSENVDEISILITDIVMPKMGGVELAEEVRKLRGGIPVIFITGYDRHQTLAADSEGSDRSMLLSKPFNIDGLSHSIRKLIE
ncbi:PAS domain S-box-containing protein [Mariprofundus aestuarium]|uniref:histidine kinase n=1 Tax=Mariprofundus aestuarium TaxID=1921086 RepID=A0A2K8L5V0_MARES|nr:PAS domain S-box protein [Mariprofundus aestuarium]ATX80354.1 PAS domain S-box-containing protein [Mariprofundus aestuarium]